jgi:hypothetical protein
MPTRGCLSRWQGCIRPRVRAHADTRLSAMDDWSDREVSHLEQLTQQFFELQQVHDLEEQFVAPFVRAHPHEFPLRVEDL